LKVALFLLQTSMLKWVLTEAHYKKFHPKWQKLVEIIKREHRAEAKASMNISRSSSLAWTRTYAFRAKVSRYAVQVCVCLCVCHYFLCYRMFFLFTLACVLIIVATLMPILAWPNVYGNMSHRYSMAALYRATPPHMHIHLCVRAFASIYIAFVILL
jgi:hypothetical protein